MPKVHISVFLEKNSPHIIFLFKGKFIEIESTDNKIHHF